MSRRTRIAVAGLIGTAVVAGAVILLNQPAGPAPGITPSATPGIVVRVTSTPTPSPTPLPTKPRVGYTPIPDDVVSPIVMQRSPAIGQEQAPGAPIEVIFDRPMNRDSVESAFQVYPALAGSFNWVTDSILQFQPQADLARNSVFDVVIDQRAQDAAGAPLNQAYQFRFATAGFLEVAQVVPAPDTADVDPNNTLITVIFNRPVVPLTTLQEQASLPQPFTLVDSTGRSIAGKGEWLNTSIFTFRANEALAGGVAFTGRIAGLADTDGNPMASDFAWSFTSAPPEVVFISPGENQTLVPIDAAVVVQFNQPIDPASAQSRFSLVAQNDQRVDGAFTVMTDTLIFTPTAPLDFNTPYRAAIDAGVTSRGGGEGSRG